VLEDEGVWNACFAARWELKEVSGKPRNASFYENAALSSTFVSRHRVASSDTVASIALKRGRSVSLLKQTNNLVSDSSLFCRAKIHIPARTLDEIRGARVAIRHCPETLREYCFIAGEDDSESEGEGGGCVGSGAEGEDEGEEEAIMKVSLLHSKRPESAKQEQKMVGLMARSLKICESEAKYYLDASEFDLKSAMATYREDLAWENTEKLKEAERMRRDRKSVFCCY